MKTFAKIAALGAALAVAPAAFATPILNGFVVTGSDNDALVGYVGGSITFAASPGEKSSGTGTGQFTNLASGTVLNFTTGFYLDNIPANGEELFQFTDAGTTYTVYVTDYTVVESSGTLLMYGMTQATGVYNFMLPSEFSFANNNGQIGPYQMEAFTGMFTLLPEPDSLLLLGTGLLLGSAMVVRKRRRV